MRRERNKNILMPTMVSFSVLVAVYEVCLYAAGYETSDLFEWIWAVVFFALVAFWVEVDSKRFAHIYRPYEFGLLVYTFWPIYVPYYMWSTRRGVGLAMLFGLLVLFQLGVIMKWLMYFAA